MIRRHVFVCCIYASIALAQSPGTFSPTGNMIAPRSGHTATLLTNGEVLIAGGLNGVPLSPLSSAELYDPLTGTFSPTGSLITPRFGQPATLLPDGRVLIVGGSADGSAEVYDPSAGRFSAVGSIPVGDYAYDPWTTATLLPDGRVLIARGTSPPFASSTAGLYDPAAGTYRATGNLFWVHAEPVATLLSDGSVIIVEGRDPACETIPYPLAEPCGGTEIYDPASGTFSPTGAVTGHPWRANPTSNLLANGKVLVTGGDGGNDILTTAEVFDPLAASFIPTADMSLSRSGHTGTLLPDGTVLIAGGGSTNIGITATAELYHSSSGTFSATGNMTTPRAGAAATLLGDGSVIITGGIGGQALSSAEIYHPAATTAAPALFSLSGDGSGPGAIWNGVTGQVASANTPATAGDILSMYTNNLIEGGAIPPQVAVGGRLAKILFFGDAPGYPGYYQVNFQVPNGMASGTAVPVRLTYIGRASNAVTIGVR